MEGPDPSVLTTAQLQREINSLEKLMTQRIDAVEKAIGVAHDDLVRVPTAVDKAIGNLRDLIFEKLATVKQTYDVHAEKFASVQTQFQERDVRTEQTAKDSKVAVDAALQAAKESVGKQQEASDRAIAKSEGATTKQIDQIGTLIQTSTAGTTAMINDIKERLTRIEGVRGGLKDGWGYLVGAVGLAISLYVVLTK